MCVQNGLMGANFFSFEVCQASTNHYLMGLANLFYQTPLEQIGQITKGFLF